MRRLSVLVLVLVLALLATTNLTALAASGALQANLFGFNEVPGPGDPDGQGFAYVTLDSATGQVCWRLYATDIVLPATASHIHRGAANVAGPVVIGFTAPNAQGNSVGCTSASASLINEILSNPAGFYVNVHNSVYPGGAIRGQLHP